LFACCWQYDAFEIGFITTDDFTNADILEATYPAVSKTLVGDWSKENAVPVVTGYLGKVYIFLTFYVVLVDQEICGAQLGFSSIL